jgi:hypothetical protein
LCVQAAAKALRLDVVHERLPAVDLDDGDQLPVAGLELVVAGDVDLAVVELELPAKLRQLRTRTLAEVAALRVKEDDVGAAYG